MMFLLSESCCRLLCQCSSHKTPPVACIHIQHLTTFSEQCWYYTANCVD